MLLAARLAFGAVTKSKRVTKLAVTKMGRAAASLGLFPLATLSPCCLPAACVRRGYEKQACYEIGCYENGTAVLALEHKDGWLHGHWVGVTRAAATGHPVHIEDLRESPAYLAGDPLPVAAVNIAGLRTLVAVPMLKEREAVGVFVIFRTEVQSFTNKQIDLVKSFANQAVIAIENSR